MAEEENDTLFDHTKMSTPTPVIDDLLPALKRLDALLERAVAQAQVVYGSKAAGDAYRGLYTNREQAEGLLNREPGAPILWKDDGEVEATPYHMDSDGTRLAWLKKVFALSAFDMDSILIALAPELDLRYERLYAYLQDHVSRKRPTVELVLNLLCPSAEAKLAHRIHFLPDAPLIRHDLLHLMTDPNQVQQPLLADYLKLDDQIIRLLLGQEGLDSRLARFCKVVDPAASLEKLPLSAETKQALPGLVSEAREKGQPLRVYFHGPSGGGKRQTAEALAGETGSRLLVVDLARALAAKTDFEQVLKLLFREAWFQDAILFLEGLDALRGDERAIQYGYLLDTLAEDAGVTILSGVESWIPSARDPLGVLRVSFPIPDFVHRRDCWEANLVAAEIPIDDYNLEALANRFRLTPGQIAEAVATACSHDRWHSATRFEAASAKQFDRYAIINSLFVAARAQSGHDLATLAHKIELLYTWEDIVLPEDALTQLREICQRVVHRHRVLGEWGFDRKLSLGKGVNALFAGPSGTGKTMAAEIIANELGLDLYKIDLSGVVSKYIGETEKNLDRIFRAAENANAILFFDEADALFGKRSEVRDSHDRYANIEISYLLQKMEQFDGIAILATNMRGNLDEGFTRRLTFTVHFPFPDEASRRRIWAGIWPAATPLADDVDLDFLARQFKLSGGNIKNIALAAAFLAAEDSSSVMMEHLLRATRREYQKMGKMLSEDELTGSLEETQPLTGVA
jgi:SpoVK/Ycf46/Vps4 family AAA+-type ATPase